MTPYWYNIIFKTFKKYLNKDYNEYYIVKENKSEPTKGKQNVLLYSNTIYFKSFNCCKKYLSQFGYLFVCLYLRQGHTGHIGLSQIYCDHNDDLKISSHYFNHLI